MNKVFIVANMFFSLFSSFNTNIEKKDLPDGLIKYDYPNYLTYENGGSISVKYFTIEDFLIIDDENIYKKYTFKYKTYKGLSTYNLEIGVTNKDKNYEVIKSNKYIQLFKEKEGIEHTISFTLFDSKLSDNFYEIYFYLECVSANKRLCYYEQDNILFRYGANLKFDGKANEFYGGYGLELKENYLGLYTLFNTYKLKTYAVAVYPNRSNILNQEYDHVDLSEIMLSIAPYKSDYEYYLVIDDPSFYYDEFRNPDNVSQAIFPLAYDIGEHDFTSNFRLKNKANGGEYNYYYNIKTTKITKTKNDDSVEINYIPLSTKKDYLVDELKCYLTIKNCFSMNITLTSDFTIRFNKPVEDEKIPVVKESLEKVTDNDFI